MEKNTLTAVIVTYKTRDLLEVCLNSLQKNLSTAGIIGRIIVVDNASSDGTVEMVRTKFPLVGLITNNDNVGPARAFNQGITIALNEAPRSEYIMVLNSDIEIHPQTLMVMYSYLEQNPAIEGVSGPLLNKDGSPQLTRTHIWNLTKPDYTKEFRVEFIGTTFTMLRASTFRKVGGYDENYYFYNEDLDWAERAKRLKCHFRFLPDAKVTHFLSKGSSQNSSRILRELYWSNIYYYKKFYGKWSLLALWVLRLEIFWRSLTVKDQMRKATSPEEFKIFQNSLDDLTVARQRMISEYQNLRPSSIPNWSEKP